MKKKKMLPKSVIRRRVYCSPVVLFLQELIQTLLKYFILHAYMLHELLNFQLSAYDTGPLSPLVQSRNN